MFSINHILIASDLTQHARAALQRAAQLKQDLGARLTLLHVVDPKTPAVQGEQHARSILEEHVGSVFESEPRHFVLEIRHGDRYDTIIAEAEAAGADLIVLGDAQKRRWKETFVGTTTERVVRMSKLPVLVVRRPGGQPYQRLLSAFDGSPAACRALAVALAVAGEAKCLVFHASMTPTLAQLATRRAGDALARYQVDAVMAALEGVLDRVGSLRARPEVRVLEGNPHFLVRDSMREFAPETTSSIVWSYGHTTIPRHLRDIVVTEYGVADLRGKSDRDVVAAMLAITDSRFQPSLLAEAKRAGKIERNYQIPDASRGNTPERIEAVLAPARSEGLLPDFPLGSELKPTEIRLAYALKGLKAIAHSKPSLLKAAATAAIGPRLTPNEHDCLQRLNLEQPHSLTDRLMRWSVLWALRTHGHNAQV